MGVKNSVFVDDAAPQCDAAYLNTVRLEINNAITNSGQTPAEGTLTQTSTAMANYAAGGDFYTDSGAADAYVLSAVGSKNAPNAYFNGMTVRFLPGNVNTTASTVNVASLGVKSIKLADGSTATSAADIPADKEIKLTYDGTNFRITALSPAGAAATDNVVTVTSTSNAATINLALADPQNAVFHHVMTEATTLTFSNPKGTGFNSGFKLFLTNAAGAYTPTWPGTVIWPGGAEPDLTTANEKNVLVFETIDGGTIWYGALSIGAAA